MLLQLTTVVPICVKVETLSFVSVRFASVSFFSAFISCSPVVCTILYVLQRYFSAPTGQESAIFYGANSNVKILRLVRLKIKYTGVLLYYYVGPIYEIGSVLICLVETNQYEGMNRIYFY